MAPGSRNTVLLIAAVGILVAAGWLFFRKRAEAGYPNDPGSRTHWICTRCAKHVELTARELEEWRDSTDKVRRDPERGKQIVLRCPDCGEFTLIRGVYCSRHDLWFAELDEQGELATCPECQKEMNP
jgi:LPXTG-motif cell wall-anchored protein